MAKTGKNYQEILQMFYPGTTIEKLSIINERIVEKTHHGNGMISNRQRKKIG